MTTNTQPGTFQARVIDYLSQYPRGTEKSSAVLAEDLDQPLNQIANMLSYSRDHGHIQGRRVGKIVYWSLPEECVEVESLRVALWKDGRLELHLDGKRFVLSAAATDELRELLRVAE